MSQLNSERYLQLERAQSLASQFWETYEELWPWLQETRADFTLLPKPAIEYEALRQQQEELRVREPGGRVTSLETAGKQARFENRMTSCVRYMKLDIIDEGNSLM